MTHTLTEIDFHILDALQKDCSISYDQMSEIVGRSPTACLRRVKRLDELGYIKSRVAVLDGPSIGFDLTGIFFVELGQDVMDLDIKLNRVCRSRPEIQYCSIISSHADFFFTAIFKNSGEYKEFIFNIIEIFHELDVREYDSHLVVREVCNRRLLPIVGAASGSPDNSLG